MNHPIISHTKTLQAYFIAWIIIAFTHWEILFILTDTSLLDAAIDAMVYNGLMMLMGLGLWYPVAYAGTGKNQGIIIAQHFVTGLVWVTIWLLMGNFLTGWLINHQSGFFVEDRNTLVIRAIVGGLMYMVFVMVYYLFVFQQNLQERIQKEEKMNALLRETELRALKSQLNPHFLFNSLNSVSALTISDADGAREMVNKLSDFLRYSLKKNEQILIPLSEEMKNASRYLEIEKVRFGDKLGCELHIPEECKKMLLPVMILQPLYENAVKHGVYESIEPVNIRTFCRSNKGNLEVSIINNYDEEGISPKGEGVGLQNVNDRLNVVYGQRELLQITRENGFYEVSLTLPQSDFNN